MTEKMLNIYSGFVHLFTNHQAEQFWNHYTRITGNPNPLKFIQSKPDVWNFGKLSPEEEPIIEKAFEFYFKYVWLPMCLQELKKPEEKPTLDEIKQNMIKHYENKGFDSGTSKA